MRRRQRGPNGSVLLALVLLLALALLLRFAFHGVRRSARTLDWAITTVTNDV